VKKNKRPKTARLYSLLKELNINAWDVLLIGDGSGSGWDIGIGWSCVIIDRNTGTRKLVHGGGSTGTVNIAELMAYVHAMLWYSTHIGKDLRKQYPRKILDVHVITDSRVIVTQGEKVGERNADGIANRALWASISDIARQGYKFHWHWIERLTNELNWAADQMAGSARRAVRSCALIEDVPNSNGKYKPVSIYDINPLLEKTTRPKTTT
jgi:ribonuclease HI